jgi:hypothetical protein
MGHLHLRTQTGIDVKSRLLFYLFAYGQLILIFLRATEKVMVDLAPLERQRNQWPSTSVYGLSFKMVFWAHALDFSGIRTGSEHC